MAIVSCLRDRRVITGRSKLGASSRRRCPVKNRDVSLPLDASTERESNDIENSVNRLTRKRCCQVQIREGRICNSQPYSVPAVKFCAHENERRVTKYQTALYPGEVLVRNSCSLHDERPLRIYDSTISRVENWGITRALLGGTNCNGP